MEVVILPIPTDNMPQYDFTDPRDQQAFRQAASSRGASIKNTNAYISKRRNEQMTSLKEQSSALQYKKEIGEFTGDDVEGKKEKLHMASVADELLQQDTKPITGKLQIRGGEGFFGRGTRAQTAVALYDQLKGLLSLENREKLKGSGAISDFEARTLEQAAAALTREMSDTEFRKQLTKVKNTLSKKAGITTIDDIVSTQGELQAPDDFIEPAVNVSGGLANVGDLVRDPRTDKMSLHGTTDDDPLFKLDTTGGFRVDNALVKFLAESEFLPIAGGFGGAVTGGVVGGMAGAAGGTAIQQGLRELLDPDRQDLSSSAKAVLVSGVTDGVFSGLTLGIGKIGSKAMGLVLTKPGSAAAKAALGSVDEVADIARGLSRESIEAGGKKLPILGSQEDLLRKAYPIPLSKKAEFAGKQGTSIYNKVIEFLDGDLTKLVDPQDAAKIAKAGKAQAGEEIGEAISGRAVKADKVIPKLEGLISDIQKEALGETGEISKIVPQTYKAGVGDLVEKISILKAEAKQSGGYISLDTLQDMKVSLNKAFKGEMVSQSSKELLRSGRGELMQTIEKYGAEGIKEANLKYYVFDLFKDSALKADEKVIRQAFDAMDIITLGSTTAASGGNIAVGAAVTTFQKLLRNFAKEPLQQLRMVNRLGSYAVEKGNKNAFRALMLATQKLNLTMGIDETLLKTGARAGTSFMGNFIGENQQEPQLQAPEDFINSTQGIGSPNQAVNQTLN
ncbi:MAG: hypothetical protein GY861_03250 [bacterium]|nr:hypothetical protein [bacterium]